jgi:hypothetical protein
MLKLTDTLMHGDRETVTFLTINCDDVKQSELRQNRAWW